MIRNFHIQFVCRPEVVLKFQMELDQANPSDAWLLENFRQGVCYEQEVAHVMMRVLRPGDFAIDVGANVGFFTLFMSKLVGETGQVLAFEAGDNVLPQLRHNLKLNEATNVKLIEQPLWCCEEEVTFWHNSDASGGNCLWDPGLWWENKRSQAKQDSKRVMATTIDVAVPIEWHGIPVCSFGPPRLIKLDTEGAEQQILEGARGTLETFRPPFILLELNPFGFKQFDNDSDTIRTYLRQYGYECFLIHNDGSLPSLVPKKTTITYQNDCAVLNVLFSTLDAVGEAWNRVPYE